MIIIFIINIIRLFLGLIYILLIHPGMILYAVQLHPILIVYSQTRADQVLALGGDLVHEGQLPLADGLVTLEGDVPTHHVIEEDPQGPHGEAVSIILLVLDPLWRSVYSCT